MNRIRHALYSLVIAAPCLGLAALSPARADGPLTLYSAQHGQMVDLLTAAFTRATGIAVRVHAGEGPEIANQIAREGDASPADVYFTENSPELLLLDARGLLAPVAPATLAAVPAQYSAPDGHWLGVLAREDVLVYDPALIKAAALPASLRDLAAPAWHGKVAIAPADADFLPLIGAMLALDGHDATLAWLRGLARNAQIFEDEEGVVAAVDRGAVATGIVNNYYWARLHAERGARSTSAIHHFGHGDIGALVNISGAAVLKSSHQQAAAQRFLAFLVSPATQQMLARSDVDFEYPLVPGIAANPLLKPFAALQPPPLTPAQIGDDRAAAALLREAGLL